MVSESVTELGRTVNLRTGATIRARADQLARFQAVRAVPGCPSQAKTMVRGPSTITRSSTVPGDRLGEHLPLDVAADPAHVLDGRAVVDPGDLLLDDRPGVELRRHVVRGRPDQLHPAVVRRPVRVRAHERRQEAVVDVDQPLREAGAELGRDDLHVPGQHHQVDVADQLAAPPPPPRPWSPASPARGGTGCRPPAPPARGRGGWRRCRRSRRAGRPRARGRSAPAARGRSG